mmetsp:Transcript_9735/g.24792  ORF Transcript_9735/g.24792 Transcript_9735/m.24792 type:complete len:250 (+) Transcript_9735:128-877(+)
MPPLPLRPLQRGHLAAWTSPKPHHGTGSNGPRTVPARADERDILGLDRRARVSHGHDGSCESRGEAARHCAPRGRLSAWSSAARLGQRLPAAARRHRAGQAAAGAGGGGPAGDGRVARAGGCSVPAGRDSSQAADASAGAIAGLRRAVAAEVCGQAGGTAGTAGPARYLGGSNAGREVLLRQPAPGPASSFRQRRNRTGQQRECRRAGGNAAVALPPRACGWRAMRKPSAPLLRDGRGGGRRGARRRPC